MKLKTELQKIRLKLGKLLLDKQTQKSPSRQVEKILFLRQDGKIGDYIVSSFVFREIKKHNPNMKIGVVCTTKNAYLFQNNAYIDQLYYVKKRNIIDYIKCGLKLREESYDAVIDPTVMLRNRDLLLLRLIKAKHYVGYKKSDYQIFDINLEQHEHFAKIYQNALTRLNIDVQDATYDVPYDEKSAVEIQQYLEENKLENYIALNFYGSAKIKKVNDENIKKYLSYISEKTNGKQIVILTYPEVTENLKQLAKDYDNIFVHNTSTIFHTIELIRHCKQLISTDTSTVHIAAGFGKPIIGIYHNNPLECVHWHPNSQGETHILRYENNINELAPQAIQPDWILS